MSDFAAFMYAVASHWVALMTGIVSLAWALYERYKGRPRERLFWSVAVIFLILAFFLAWKDEFKRAEDLEAKLNASSGEVLKTKLNQLETELKEARERLKRQKIGEWEPLSEHEKKDLETLLSQFIVPQVIVHYYDQRGEKLARDFAEVFSKVGWPQPTSPKPDRAIGMIRIYA